MIYPRFIDHLVLRVTALRRSEAFYTALLGQPADRTESSVMYMIGDTRLFLTLSDDSSNAPYDKEKAGLNHLAFGVRAFDELQTIQRHLDSRGISHSRIQKDRHGQKDFIWLDDPDGMRIEVYLRAPSGKTATTR